MEYLVRYGVIPEVARCRTTPGQNGFSRGQSVVIESHRGLQMGAVVESVRDSGEVKPPDGAAEDEGSSGAFSVLRMATLEDLQRQRELQSSAEAEFADWVHRIQTWKIDVQLIDLEWTLDRTKRILYVLNERGPECTKLAIQAAAAGLGIIEVQPVSSEGLVSQPGGGGCGSCGCHN